ncbi:DNA-directed RNA polymerase II subunit rpb1-like [Portunus trituberculatus]|uniref:DNA-directed RNA polymerase II subunit rpb1-like n=1 Tax=Portunus trituberculatus TaxID=210409 RepID=UPI001E1D099B|nr:DNA-directed RNA polymerase II subunit rpb1-like [Portunus trituberculatus]
MSGKSHSPSAPPPYSMVDPYMSYPQRRASTPPHNGNTAPARVPNHGESKTSAPDTAPNHGRYPTTGSKTCDPLPPKTSAPGPSSVENSVTYTPHSQAPASAYPYTPSQASPYQPYAPSPAPSYLPHSSYPQSGAASFPTPYPYGYAVPSSYSPYTTAPTVIVSMPNQTPPPAYAPYQVPGMVMQGNSTMAPPEESFNDESATDSCRVHGSDYTPHYHPLPSYHPLLGYHHHHYLGHHHHHNRHNPGNQ